MQRKPIFLSEKGENGIKNADLSFDGTKKADSEVLKNLPLEIVLEQAPVTISDMVPAYRYKFTGLEHVSSDTFMESFTEFLRENSYLVMDDVPDRRYADGFQKAVAICALFMDSLQVER